MKNKLFSLRPANWLFLACCLLPVANCFSQAPNYLWANSAGGTSFDEGWSCSTDASGNVIATGAFQSSTINFGATSLTNADNTGNTSDIFIVKYDPSGNVLWAQRAGGTSNDYSQSCSTDASGNIIATGYFQSSTITFGTTTLTNVDNTGNTYDMFIVKYDANGNVLWAKSAGGTFSDVVLSCSTDASGNVIATGAFQSSTITFGTTTLSNANNTGNIYAMFIVKYDANGNVLWAKSAGGTSDNQGRSCSTDASGNIIAAGFFDSLSITFGTITLTNVYNSNTADIFIVKYDSNGNVLWAKSAGGTFSDVVLSCSTDASGNIIATGYFGSSTLTFGTTTLTNASYYNDMFIVKYDSNGNLLWAKNAGGTSDDWGYSCSTDASGNVIATGAFQSPTITFGTTTLNNTDNTGNIYDMFIVKYDPSGNVLWAQRAGGTSYDEGRSCSTDASGNIIATGLFWSPTITFGTTTLTNASNYNDMFIVKLDGATGINEMMNDELRITIFPNPTSGVFQLRIANCQNCGLKIYNTLGKIVKQSEIHNPKSEIRN